jgi:DNA-binding LacI/PurR family transcriptional regulator
MKQKFQFEGGERAVSQLFALDSPPSAVFLCNDLMAFGALRALRKLGRRIPEDVSIIGFDDIKLASVTSPALTTIPQPLVELSKTAVELLIQRIQEGENMVTQRVILEPVLISRESCTAYKGSE